jgi:hypothetical protein
MQWPSAFLRDESVDPGGLWREQIDSASPDLLRAMVKTFADALMSAEADAVCGAGYGERSAQRDGAFDSHGGAPTAGDPPYDVYEVVPAKAFGLSTETAPASTRWVFGGR